MADILDARPMPVITMGGTSAKELLEGRVEVLNALRKARDLVAYHHPNARDYNDYAPARAAHEEDLRQLNELIQQHETLAIFIADDPRAHK